MLPTSRRRYPFKHHHSNVSGSSETNPRLAIQRTTSETLRVERDLEVTNINSSKVTDAQSNPVLPSTGCTIKKPTLILSTGYSSSFVVTNVSQRPDYVEACDSPEPDSCSIETPSFSEDTQSYSRDLDDLMLASSTNTAASTSSIQVVYPGICADLCEKNEAEDPVECDAEGTEHSPRADGRYIGRFQVVKVESMGKFKRGRWHYQDYLDDSPHVPLDGYVFKDGCFVKNTNDRTGSDSTNTSTKEAISVPSEERIADIKSNVPSEYN